MPPMTGRVIAGRYNLQHPIGRGAMGVVWRARDQILDRDVAVKEVLISSLLGEEERRNAYQRTLREARTAARLSHRGLVAVYDVAEEDGRPWIVMELVPSRSLDQVLTVEGRLPALRVARIGQQLLSALAAAHLAGVLHRDVKPSNVLIATDRTGTGWDERAVLTDFGIAQFEGDPRLTQTGMVMGSPGFTAPERIRGGDATPASDLWSLGATLYAAVEGRGPYEQRGGAITTMSAIINEDAPIAAHAGRLAQVIAALLRREPSARPSAPTAARMFAQVLSALANSEDAPSSAHPPTVVSRPVPPPAAPVRSAAAAPPTPAAAAGGSSPDLGDVTLVPADAATAQEDSAPALALLAPAPVAAIAAPSVEAPSPADASDGAPSADAGSPEAAAVAPASPPPAADAEAPAEPGQAESNLGATPSAAAAVTLADADEGEAAPEAAISTSAADAPRADAAAAYDVEAADADASAVDAVTAADAADADAASADEPADAAAEGVSAVEAVSAIEAVKTRDDSDADNADAPSAEPAKAGAGKSGQSGLASTIADDQPPTPDARTAPPTPAPAQRPKPSPSFTAARPGERSATPTFSAAPPAARTEAAGPRPAPSAPQRSGYQPAHSPHEAPQYGPPQYESAQPGSAQSGSAQYGANAYSGSSYPGRSAPQSGGTAPYPDRAIPYTPGGGGGAAKRRRRPGRRILIVIVAVLIAVAIGAGAALALSHHSPPAASATHHTTTTTIPQSVNALNHPSSTVPKGWQTTTVEPIAGKTAGGFTIALPPGWTKRPKGLATDFTGPSDQMFLEIDLTPHKHPNNMIAEAQSIEQGALAANQFPGYQRTELKQVTVRGAKAAFWQFTWERKDAKVRTDDILFVLPTQSGAGQSYAVYLRGLNSVWNTVCLPLFDQILNTFQTIPPST
jgi:eukaryotic-like serine/threonine-protein kinase